ncbi:MAG TPA: GYD domain-containing protein [Candidatus Deferrimicrobiaceae bacterium]|nr:GYD domain-containing protein [Candidatus Deferrimicrobiaceae bacterium]
MPTYIMLTRISPEAVSGPKFVEKLEKKVSERIKKNCPEVTWKSSYSILGPYDYLDIFEAPDGESATKVALLVRSYGHGTTETWVATPWDRYVELAKDVSK